MKIKGDNMEIKAKCVGHTKGLLAFNSPETEQRGVLSSFNSFNSLK